MKVKDLIAELNTTDPELSVYIAADSESSPIPARYAEYDIDLNVFVVGGPFQ